MKIYAKPLKRRAQMKAERRRNYFEKTVRPIVRNEKMQSTKKLIQHGDVSVFAHSMAVAAYSVKLAKKLGIRYDRRSLIRGAVLHDFFLYDWHKINNVGDGLHGFAHPNTASKNAVRYFALNKRELDIIRKHMWPLTLTKLPKYRESWIVCAADKYCSLLETLGLNTYDDDTFIKHIAEERRPVRRKQPGKKL
ncbi:MAG TPA: HD family phosphohydrolase [Ruminococcaceae bacterium]|nr:HD family phosphohydrolase [Oscillospiraceae bacterium]